MSDILKYKFYLNFKNENSFGRIQISEAIGFDGSSFVVEQEAKRYGRDAYKFNEEISLSFYKGNFEEGVQQELPNGTVIFYLTQGFDWLIETYNEYAHESNVDFEIELDGLVFIPSNLDFVNAETDEYSYFTCKAVQTQGRQLIKRRSEVVTDIFSTIDLDNNAVTPAQTENILLKAKPVRQVSKWQFQPVDFDITSFGFQQFAGFPLFNNLIDFNIENSLTSFSTNYTAQITNEPNFLEQYREDISIIKAQSDLSNIQIKIRGLSFTSFADDPVYVNKQLTVNYGTSYVAGEFETIELEQTIDDNFNVSNQYYDVTIPFLPNGGFIYIQYSMLGLSPSGGATPVGSFSFNQTSGTLEISATSTAINSVIKGVRYVDVFRENIKRINSYSLDAERFDSNGKYYEQYAFTGNLIKQRNDLPFEVKFKDITDDLAELNCDYQIIDGEVYIGQYPDFYPNKEIAAFLSTPDSTFKKTGNERFAINEFSYKYKTFEQDRDESNTTDAIHTDTQWLTSNKQVENTKPVDIGLIRDPYKIESTRKLGLKETTSTADDDKLFVIDVVPLSPSTRGGFTSVLAHNIDANGNVQLRRTEQFKWTLLGINVGSSFDILEGENIGSYIVLELDESLIRLEPQGFTPTYSGETFTRVEYPYSNVNLTNRTNEGLVYFENLINGDDFSNLKYSIKRNIETWKPYLATASIDENGTFRNTKFKDNSLCTTRFNDESENIEEGADIANNTLGTPVLTPYKYETRLVVPYKDMKTLIDLVDTINEDKTIGGFIRCIDNNGRVKKLYPQKLDYLPSTETLTMTGEERYESNVLTITTSSTEVTINEVGYDIDVLSDPFYEFDGDYFKIYDSNGLPVINPTRYDNISVNGQTFNSSSELLGYLVDL